MTSSKKNLAIIGASYLQLPLILKAKEMGYITHVFAWKADDVGEKEADYFYPISITKKEEIYKVCKGLNLEGICTIASDLAVVTVNYVANKLGLNANNMDATYVSSNKHAMRLRFEKCGDPSPKSIEVSKPSDIDNMVLSFPLIVKPTDRSGSRGINKVYNKEELKLDILKALEESFEKKALIEEFVEGQEYSVEYISYKGKHTFLALTLKYTTGAMRLRFEKCGDPSPKSIEVSKPSDIDNMVLSFPLIVKPTDRSGSRGINKVYNKEELKLDILKALEESFEKKALIEEFVEGQEYSVEYISYKGKHTFLALTLKYTTGAPYFIETGHLEPAPVDGDTLKRIQDVVSHALTSLGVSEGASHSEIKIDEKGNIKIIEIGARMGGDCIGSDLVYYSTGYDFLRMVIEVACNKTPTFIQNENHFPVEVRFILSESDLKTFLDIKEHHPEKLLKVVDYHPEKIGKTTDSSNRAGCYIIRK